MPTANLTPKQRKCRHPFQNVHPTYDPRWETCDLCHIVRPAVPVAPWIEAHDAAAPAPEAPPLFGGLADLGEEEQPARQTAPARIEEQRPAPVAMLRPRTLTRSECARRDAALLGLEEPAPTPDLPEELRQTCPRCEGEGNVSAPDRTRRACPRCQGKRIIARYSAQRYSAATVRPEDTAPHSASSYSASSSASSSADPVHKFA